jgi:four helix bundle protein
VRVQRDIEDRAFGFALRITLLSRSLAGCDPILRVLAIQALKAGTSIGANLEEARAAQSRPDFISKCAIARKEAFEVRYWLRLLLATELAEQRVVLPLVSGATELVAILTAIVKKAQLSSDGGSGRNRCV